MQSVLFLGLTDHQFARVISHVSVQEIKTVLLLPDNQLFVTSSSDT